MALALANASYWERLQAEIDSARDRQENMRQKLQTRVDELRRAIDRAEVEWREQRHVGDELATTVRSLLPRVEKLLSNAERRSLTSAAPVSIVMSWMQQRSEDHPQTCPLTPPVKLSPDDELCIAAKDGDVVRAQQLLDSNKVDVNTVNLIGLVPLHIATRHGHHEMVKLLLERGADVSRRTPFNKTSLHLAALHNHPQCIKYLANNGANVDEPANNGYRPLHIAALRGHKLSVMQLLESGADRELRDVEGHRPTDVAASQSIRMLLSTREDTESNNSQQQQHNIRSWLSY